MMDKFEILKGSLKPIFKWVPPLLREKIIYPYFTYYAKPLYVPRPKLLVLELSNICNLKCKMCNRPSNEAPAGNMDLALAKDMLRAAHDCGIKEIAFHTVGEPLLYPYLEGVLIAAKNFGFPLNLSANANLLTEEKSDMLIRVGLDNLRVSMEGTNSVYDSIRKGGSFPQLIKNIKYLYEKRKTKGKPQITCNYVITKESVESILDFKENYSYFFNSIMFCPAINQGYIQNEYVAKNSLVLFKNDRYPCLNLWTNMYITFNGDVSICCVDYNHKLIVGNVRNKPLLDIWNSPEYMHYRKLNREGKVSKIKFCSNCSIPVLISFYHMRRFADLLRKKYNLDIKILGRY